MVNRRYANVSSGNVGEFMEAIKNASSGLGEYYYGDMCQGYLEAILEDPDYQAAEFEKMRSYLDPIIRLFGAVARIDTFRSILSDLQRGLEETNSIDNGSFKGIYTLPLPFEGERG